MNWLGFSVLDNGPHFSYAQESHNGNCGLGHFPANFDVHCNGGSSGLVGKQKELQLVTMSGLFGLPAVFARRPEWSRCSVAMNQDVYFLFGNGKNYFPLAITGLLISAYLLLVSYANSNNFKLMELFHIYSGVIMTENRILPHICLHNKKSHIFTHISIN